MSELKATNETLKSLQTQLELAYASTASSGAPVAGSTGTSSGFGSSPYNTIYNTATHFGGSVAVPDGIPGSTTLTAILETKDARIQTLEKEVSLLEAELQRIRECGGRLREQLLKATAVPSGGCGNITSSCGLNSNTGSGGGTNIDTINRGHSLSLPSALESLQSAVLTRGPSGPHAQTPNSSALTNPLLTTSTGGASSCLAGISSGLTTGVVNPYADRHHQQPTQLQQQQHHYHHHHHHQYHQQQQQQQQQQQHQNAIQQHLKQIEPAAAGALALHAHTFNKHDLNFKRQ
ncbi:hypothetical protein PV325_004023, partial [Microctonus aethiopoides]